MERHHFQTESAKEINAISASRSFVNGNSITLDSDLSLSAFSSNAGATHSLHSLHQRFLFENGRIHTTILSIGIFGPCAHTRTGLASRWRTSFGSTLRTESNLENLLYKSQRKIDCKLNIGQYIDAALILPWSRWFAHFQLMLHDITEPL